MFTMKKFAVLAVSALFAASMIGCPDGDPDGDSSSSVVTTSSSSSGPSAKVWTLADLTGTGWNYKGTVKLGGISNANLGSFLDIDGNIEIGDDKNATASAGQGPAIYTRSQAAAKKDDIDLVYDGTNLWTASACAQSCPTTPSDLKAPMSGAEASRAIFVPIPASVAAAHQANACNLINAAGNVAGTWAVNSPIMNYPGSASGTIEGGVYLMRTISGGYDAGAIILVGEKNNTTQTLDLVIGYRYSLSSCQ